MLTVVSAVPEPWRFAAPARIHPDLLTLDLCCHLPVSMPMDWSYLHIDLIWKAGLQTRQQENEREEGGKTENASVCWFTPHVVMKATSGSGGSQEPGTPPRFPCEWQVAKHVGPLPLLPQAH